MDAPPPDWPATRTVLRVVGVLLVIALVLWLAWQARSVAAWVAISALLATAINPLVERITPLVRYRALAVLIMFAGVVALIAGIIIMFAPAVIEAAQSLATQLPGVLDEMQRWRWVQWLDGQFGIVERVQAGTERFVVSIIEGPGDAVGLVSDVANRILAVVSIAFMSVLFALSGPRIWAKCVEIAGPAHEERLRRLGGDVYRVVGNWVLGAIAVTTISTLSATILMVILGLPYIPLLALWLFLLTFIPLLGPALGATPYILLAFLQGPGAGIAAVVFFVVYQQVEANVIGPAVMRKAVRLQPLWAIIAALVGVKVFGLLGALVAIPTAGVIQVLLADWWDDYRAARMARHEDAPGANEDLAALSPEDPTAP